MIRLLLGGLNKITAAEFHSGLGVILPVQIRIRAVDQFDDAQGRPVFFVDLVVNPIITNPKEFSRDWLKSRFPNAKVQVWES